ncbi:MAG: hypothetical protein INQ03_02400 [Candidatus Heimdallarchaeota archaeon]|nr:hypothetical protein [Candidatus Heimdallarchaeota archaeon]
MTEVFIVGIIVVSLPIFAVITLGPTVNKERLLYMMTGFASASFIGLLLSILNIKAFIDHALLQELAVHNASAITEELIRFPSLLIAEYLALKYVCRQEINTLPTTFRDHHGLGLYFGVGYGYIETIVYYIYPNLKNIINGTEGDILAEIQPWLYRITAIGAHIALTYLAMAITQNRHFYKFTIGLHMSFNTANVLFLYITPNFQAEVLWVLFSRIALVIIVYFMLRPRMRYITPAILLLIEVVMFLFFVLIGTFLFLLSELIATNLIDL